MCWNSHMKMQDKRPQWICGQNTQAASHFPEVNAYSGWFPSPWWRQGWNTPFTHHSYSWDCRWDLSCSLPWTKLLGTGIEGKAPNCLHAAVQMQSWQTWVIYNSGHQKRTVILVAVILSVAQYKPLSLSLVFVPHRFPTSQRDWLIFTKLQSPCANCAN